MIVHITEQFHDYGLQRYYVETNDLSSELDPPNPIEKLVLDACKKKAFCHEIIVDVDEKRSSYPNNGFWEDPAGAISTFKMAIDDSTIPEKAIYLRICFG